MKNLSIIITMILLTGCITVTPPKSGPQYTQEFNVASSVSGIDLNLLPVGSAWNTTITNNSDRMVKFIIDESSYVTTAGVTEKLIRGQTRIMHSDMPQSSVTIPPKAKFVGILIPESCAGGGYYSNSAWLLPRRIGNTDVKGKFYFVFEIDGKKSTWISEVKYTKIN